jgi:DNA mismatch repair protein MLH1
MLDEYFRIGFDTAADEGHGALISLPDLLPSYTPSPAALPLFLLRLATEVDWEEEQPCFEGVATELGLFYSDLSVHYEEGVEEEKGKAEERDEEEVVILGVEGGKGLRGGSTKRVEKEKEKMEGETGPVPKKYEYLLQHVLFPAFRAVFLPPRELAATEAQVVVQIAALEQLYRVFERC